MQKYNTSDFIVGDMWQTDSGIHVTVEHIAKSKAGDTIRFETAAGRLILRTLPQMNNWEKLSIAVQ